MSELRFKSDATHLNFERSFLSIFGHELWPLHPLPSPRSGRSQVSTPAGPTLRCGEQGSSFWVSTAVDLHGLCATDLEGRTARHSHLSQRQTGGTLPSWLPRVLILGIMDWLILDRMLMGSAAKRSLGNAFLRQQKMLRKLLNLGGSE